MSLVLRTDAWRLRVDGDLQIHRVHGRVAAGGLPEQDRDLRDLACVRNLGGGRQSVFETVPDESECSAGMGDAGMEGEGSDGRSVDDGSERTDADPVLVGVVLELPYEVECVVVVDPDLVTVEQELGGRRHPGDRQAAGLRAGRLAVVDLSVGDDRGGLGDAALHEPAPVPVAVVIGQIEVDGVHLLEDPVLDRDETSGGFGGAVDVYPVVLGVHIGLDDRVAGDEAVGVVVEYGGDVTVADDDLVGRGGYVGRDPVGYATGEGADVHGADSELQGGPGDQGQIVDVSYAVDGGDMGRLSAGPSDQGDVRGFDLQIGDVLERLHRRIGHSFDRDGLRSAYEAGVPASEDASFEDQVPVPLLHSYGGVSFHEDGSDHRIVVVSDVGPSVDGALDADIVIAEDLYTSGAVGGSFEASSEHRTLYLPSGDGHAGGAGGVVSQGAGAEDGSSDLRALADPDGALGAAGRGGFLSSQTSSEHVAVDDGVDLHVYVPDRLGEFSAAVYGSSYECIALHDDGDVGVYVPCDGVVEKAHSSAVYGADHFRLGRGVAVSDDDLDVLGHGSAQGSSSVDVLSHGSALDVDEDRIGIDAACVFIGV